MSRKSIILKRDILLLAVITILLAGAAVSGIGALISSKYIPSIADHPKTLKDEAWEMWKKGDYQLALMYFDRAVELAPHSRDVYLGRGATLYAIKRFNDARSDFIKAKQAEEGDPAYPALYLWLATARTKNTDSANQQLAEDIRSTQIFPELWPRRIATYLLGQITEEQLMRSAERANRLHSKENRCEAYFYVGSRLLIEGDEAGAIFRFKNCLAENQGHFYEHYSAQAELRNLKIVLPEE